MSDIPDYMEPTGRTDAHKGREHQCQHCEGFFWTAWGNAKKHDCRDGEEVADAPA